MDSGEVEQWVSHLLGSGLTTKLAERYASVLSGKGYSVSQAEDIDVPKKAGMKRGSSRTYRKAHPKVPTAAAGKQR